MQYAIRRLLIAVPMLLGAMSIVFFAMRILPGDPCLAMMGDQATKEALNDCVHHLGLDQPLVVQYADYLWKSVRLDFGRSFRHQYWGTDYIVRMFPYTLDARASQHAYCAGHRPAKRGVVRAAPA